jgi:hypothetical protein
MIVALLTETWFFPHYAAPVASLAFLLVVESLRQTRRFTWRGKPVGHYFVSGVLPMLLVSAIASFALTQHWQEPSAWYRDRGRILQELGQGKEPHLVIVHYDPNHSFGKEWVYNQADIDGSKVVWARDMGPEANKELIKYFKDRHVWLLEADQLPRHLTPYPGVHLTSK